MPAGRFFYLLGDKNGILHFFHNLVHGIILIQAHDHTCGGSAYLII